MAISEKIRVNALEEQTVPFNNKVDYCIGTGRMGLALQKEYFEQLKLVQEAIGFEYIRGHGLFSDDMAIYHEYEEDGIKKAEYNFTYLDLVMDNYQSLGIKPFLELGFMPKALASGDQTVFYWKGNVTPPKSYEGWCQLVQATLKHLMTRYGEANVLTWPIEVWNEPNLPGFWKDADMEEYFKLFKETFYAIKAVHPDFKVGGPAICGVDDERWIREFLVFCEKESIPIDFVTRHHYTTEMPERAGHYGYQALTEPEYGKENLHTTRKIVDEFKAYKGKEIHITEFNTSYIPNNPIHDTNQNAAFIAHQLSWLGEDNASYSYWTFGDIFEEFGVPFTPFHGGFGLVANGGIPKPTFWSFEFFKQLKKGKCIYKDDHTVIVKEENGKYKIVAWNHGTKREGKKLAIDYFLNANEKEYGVIERRVGEQSCNPLKLWHDMGEPKSLSKEQKKLLITAASPQINSYRKESVDKQLELSIALDEFDVVYLEIEAITSKSDRGYDYSRVMQYH